MTPSIISQGYSSPQIYATIDLARTPAISKAFRKELLNSGPIPHRLDEVEAIEQKLDATLRDSHVAHIFVGAARVEVVSSFEADLWRDERRAKALRFEDSLQSAPGPKIERAVLLSNSLAPEYLRTIENLSGVSSVNVDLTEFVNGELRPSIRESVRDRDVFLLFNCSSDVNNRLMELFLTIDAVKRAGADRVTVVAPSFPYARGDRKGDERSAIPASCVCRLLEEYGVHRVVAFDLHAGQVEGFVSFPFDNLLGLPLITKAIAEDYPGERFIIAFPDSGMAKRAKDDGLLAIARTQLGEDTPVIQMDKDRIGDSEVGSVEMRENRVPLAGRSVVILDDMIDSGGTIRKAAKTLREAGAQRVLAGSTLGVFSGDAIEQFRQHTEVIDSVTTRPLEAIYVTDAIGLRRATGDLIRTVSIGPLLGEVIRRLAARNGESLRELRKSFYLPER
jgi:ribose-phosphate pyrophosphokinase